MKETKPAPEKKTDQNKDGGSEFTYLKLNLPCIAYDTSQGSSYLSFQK